MRHATLGDAAALARLRHALWPDGSEAEHRQEVERFLRDLERRYLQYFRWEYVHLGLQLLGQPDSAYAVPTFADACQVQAVTDAIYRSGRAGGVRAEVA